MKINEQEVGKALILTDVTQQVEREARKSEYVTTVSHELRSPLTLIQGYAKILRLTGNLNEQQDDYIGNIIENVEEMKSLVQNLLDIGRLETGDPLEISTFAADDLIQKVADSMMVQARQKNIQLRVNKPEEPHMIAADLTFVTQALKNLVDNGIKFTKMGGEVTIALSTTETDVVFSVEDNGIGISPLDQRHLFEKFQRIIPSTGETQSGGGLGLAIVKSIAEHHGGKVWIESQLGKGSTFYLSVPQPPVNSGF
jgi:signal transduction histidine kinase